MDVDKRESELLNRAVNEWEQTGKLSAEQAAALRETIISKQTARQQIAQYFFFIALFCTLLAFGAIFINEKFLEKLKVYFSLNDLVIALITTALSVAWFWYVGKKRNNLSPAAYEVYMVLGGLSVLTSLVYFCKEFHIDATYTAFLSIALPILIILGAVFRSSALWIGAIATSVAWFESFSTWQSSNNLFLGMNYPVRFAVFGLLILGVSFAQKYVKKLEFSQRITYASGLILFLCGLWAVSVFGNYNTLVGWQAVRQVHVLAYSILFAVAAAASFYMGIRYKDELARDLGMLFLLLNLYTRYFEYFWDSMNKGIFFLVLAVTFGFLGWFLERKRKEHPITTEADKTSQGINI
ncbi:MAG: hypothetical protein JWQ38_1433 [Flavipsychrobacter sp.]|nr:hypothetical protein [Flavipsychrobacter sp.]